MEKTVAFSTLGCKVNHYETEAMWQIFKDAGYSRVEFEDNADVFVVNTCTVTNTGDKKSRQVIRRAIRQNPDAVIAVSGCYAQTAPKEIEAIPGVDIIIGTENRDKLIDYVEQYHEERQPINRVQNIMKKRTFEEMDVPYFTDRTRATLKIQEGCNNFCTFCIIPWARGLMRSRDPEKVIEQAEKLVEAGYKEIILTGIHTGGYGEDLKDYNLAMLLRDLEKVEGLNRLRISSIEASQLTDEVLEVIYHSNKIVRHFHIPVQSASDTVLKRMRRKYTMDFYESRILRLKEMMPGAAITSDVIVGFPGETEEEFMETYDFIKKHHFSELHVFPYSTRTGTPAARMKDQIDNETKEARVKKLIELSDALALSYAEKFKDDVLEIIPEKMEDGILVGHADNYMKVAVDGDESLTGELVKVKVTEPGYPVSKGEIVKVLEKPMVKQYDYLERHVHTSEAAHMESRI
ncbi:MULTISPECIES: tRNA (N(6)-L-threonylcarbamoyladenosine(37)-C(2))-methylthiotransferase MtaB [unclassified Nosocomiicoccus]|uniref:tRNA (N(6)-L-threonylcarbamoyladenosine(37)-C(2))- methylthiotransferase MtaB n=1 Tax=unclassified Nosocomiicoccus TaxID=2646683 RepID=UPI0008A22F64|nr:MULTISPECIES: tRNA (N(6)-L-threonylcarbamoyladenosine(37)-C(2))-methylthiotransferase MtaB [unclassified Nosocomiicoccus]OFL47107.1 tRNA (N(6)-L-threonylcarbamoyladenosine(37)-C(2))-methylthiotransferase MtaB [Nosocomiicoccus sp. HMSC067E10]OFO51406.1 tRNA (N(6)-L-threonylcarbamoyladenosine(37)-C(2))-methylthiotransferase MtaB [Nosocomiicoccus sp. HMSC059G07]